MAKTICWFQHKKRIEAEKYDGKAFYKLMSNDVYSKAKGNFRHRIDMRLVSKKKAI